VQSQLLSNITGVMVQPNKAIVGKECLRPRGRYSSARMLKNRITYEIMTLSRSA
jgi:2-isopropylmalate synthase